MQETKYFNFDDYGGDVFVGESSDTAKDTNRPKKYEKSQDGKPKKKRKKYRSF